MLADVLDASDEKAAQKLAGAPWQDPRTRSAKLIAADMHEARMVVSREMDRRADAARAEVNEARGRVGFLDRLAGMLGVRTVPVRDLNEAEIRVAQAEAARDNGDELRAELARIDGQARVLVRAREAEREAWSRRPDVVAARREMHGNDLMRAAMAAGDRQIGYLATADLPVARQAVLRREAEQVRQSVEQARRQEQDRRTRATGAEGASRDGWSPSPP